MLNQLSIFHGPSATLTDKEDTVDSSDGMTRRQFAFLIFSASVRGFSLGKLGFDDIQRWVCPMDPDIRSDRPGVCPRCGMQLVLRAPNWIEYRLQLSHWPARLTPGTRVEIIVKMFHPESGKQVSSFELIHEKLLHLFIVGEGLQFFAHLHPEPLGDGSFRLITQFPHGGMYRCLADYYPSGATSQLSVSTFFVEGRAPRVKLSPSMSPSQSINLTATLRTEPEDPIAAVRTLLFVRVEPRDGLEQYLGSWGHMLVASEDTIDLLHVHPTRVTSDSEIQFDVIFPRPGISRVWIQFQRLGRINTVVFTVPVRGL